MSARLSRLCFCLAGIAALDLAVWPATAQGPAGNRAKEDARPTLLRQAGVYSESHPVIAIAISKGQKDTLTGEQIGDKLTQVLKQVHDVPCKYFVAPGGDYTTIAFFVKGHAYGPFGLKESLSALSIAAGDFHDVFPKASARADGTASIGKQ